MEVPLEIEKYCALEEMQSTTLEWIVALHLNEVLEMKCMAKKQCEATEQSTHPAWKKNVVPATL